MRPLFMGLLLGAWALAAQATPPTADATQVQLQEIYFDAARAGDTQRLAAFVDAHYNLDTQDASGYTGLILAAYHGQQAAVEQLLKAGANPCTQDKHGNTALMGAIFKGELTIANRLVQANCTPDERNNAGQTAAMYAALFQRKDILDALAAKGADLNAKDALGNDVNGLSKGQFQPSGQAR